MPGVGSQRLPNSLHALYAHLKAEAAKAPNAPKASYLETGAFVSAASTEICGTHNFDFANGHRALTDALSDWNAAIRDYQYDERP